MSRRVVVIGDTLLDTDIEGKVTRLAPDAPIPVVEDPKTLSRPGGAGLAACLAAHQGSSVVLVTAISADAPGRELLALLRNTGIELVDLALDGPTPEKIRIRAAGRSLLRLDRGCGPAAGILLEPRELTARLLDADAVLVSDYGRGLAGLSTVRQALAKAASSVPLVWDPHPKGPDPVPGVSLATPNAGEARERAPDTCDDGITGCARAAWSLLRRWKAGSVAVTMGAKGALVVDGTGMPVVVPAPKVQGGDPCGAGDMFAATAASLLAGRAPIREAVQGAVASASNFVAGGGAAAHHLEDARIPTWRPGMSPDPFRLAESVRAAGGTVVATGGCFDVIHTGHVGLLQGARALGDCLIVCLNSDVSVRRLKGASRPLVHQQDRKRVLEAFDAVDAVAVFDEDTPCSVLDRLRPHIFAKGGDYSVLDLPEAQLVSTWGGRTVVLPYLKGRSTSNLVEGGIQLAQL